MQFFQFWVIAPGAINPSRTKPFLPTHKTKGGGEFYPTHGSHISERDTATLSKFTI